MVKEIFNKIGRRIFNQVPIGLEKCALSPSGPGALLGPILLRASMIS